MAEPELLTFDYKEVVTALVRQAGLHEGIWGIHVEFGIAAGNVADASRVAFPTALVPVLKIGLRRVATVDGLSVDAAEVNPEGQSNARSRKPPTRGATKPRKAQA